MSTVSRLNWNLEMLVFGEGGKPENPEQNPWSRDENQEQTQPTYDTESGNRTRVSHPVDSTEIPFYYYYYYYY